MINDNNNFFEPGYSPPISHNDHKNDGVQLLLAK